MNFLSSLSKNLLRLFSTGMSPLDSLATYPIIAILKVHRHFTRKLGGLYIYPHFNARSIRLRLPSSIFVAFFGIFFITLVGLTALSIKNIVLGVFETRAQYEYNQNQAVVEKYQDLLKKYIAVHDQKELRVKNSVALLFGKQSLSPYSGVGGSIVNDKKNAKLLENYVSSPSLPTDWDQAFSDIPDEQYLTYVDEHLSSFNDILTLIDKFEIRLSQQKKIAKSIPTAWPIRSVKSIPDANEDADNSSLTPETKAEIEASLEENTQNIALSEESITDLESVLSVVTDDQSSTKESIVLDINQPMAVVATSRGIVEDIIKKDDAWSIKIQHEFGFATYYEGLEEVSVKKDQLVNRLAEIGKVGINAPASTKKTTPNNSELNISYQPKLKYKIKIARNFVNPRDFLIFNY